MKVSEQPSLQGFNTFGVCANTALMIEIEAEEDLLAAPQFDPQKDLVLGGGSNLLLVSDVPGTVFLNRITGRNIIESRGNGVIVEAGAGENWHSLVDWTLRQGLSGLENLSWIPGLTGAAPIQNIGAYGVELSSVLDFVTAWDWEKGRWISFNADECRLEYRDSLFKTEAPDRYLITSVGLRLSRRFAPQLGYQELAESLERAGIERPTPREVSDAVIGLRRSKLPEPSAVGNAGSFFKNPVVTADEAETLSDRFPGLPVWPAGAERAKLSAGWLIEQCGLKGHRDGDAAVSALHALVLVNLGQASGRQLLDLGRTSATRSEPPFQHPVGV